jgi:hypothetical protein
MSHNFLAPTAKSLTEAMSGSLQYERPVPKFLQAYIKPKVHFDSDEPSVADGDHSNSSKAKIEERPDRDDEAPQIANADEYEKELEHGLVDGIAAVTVYHSYHRLNFRFLDVLIVFVFIEIRNPRKVQRRTSMPPSWTALKTLKIVRLSRSFDSIIISREFSVSIWCWF